MARAQLARQMSSGSSTLRQRASRILKTNSAGNSPQGIQRRRTTSSHITSQHQSDRLPQNTQNPRQSMGHYPIPYPASVNATRPVSWHPTVARGRGMDRRSHHEVPARYSGAGYQTMAVHGLPTPMTQPDFNTEAPIDQYFSLDGSSVSYQQQPMPYNQYNSTGLSLDTTYQSALPFGPQYYMQYPSMPLAQASSTTSAIGYPTQAWAESLRPFPTHTAPPSPDFLPIQNPMDVWDGSLGPVNPLPRKQSKELVGMGLYDQPDRTSFSMGSINESYVGSYGIDPQQGKGLKLEETWEPPEEDKESDDEEEVQDEENASSAEEEVSPIAMPMDVKQEEQLYLTYPDLSNQSFFFEDDDGYFDGGGGYPQQGETTMALNYHGLVSQNGGWM